MREKPGNIGSRKPKFSLTITGMATRVNIDKNLCRIDIRRKVKSKSLKVIRNQLYLSKREVDWLDFIPTAYPGEEISITIEVHKSI